MEHSQDRNKPYRAFTIIVVLGAPGAGKGTLCTHLAATHNLHHYSIGDALRNWMQRNRGSPLAATIQDKLTNQGFLTSSDLNPFIARAIWKAMHQEPQKSGILIDGFPRNMEQMESWTSWPFPRELPLEDGVLDLNVKPDVVLALRVSKKNAKERFIARNRDVGDDEEKFERRFVEYEHETVPVEEGYRQRGVLIDINVNGTRKENVAEMTRRLGESGLWQRVVVERRVDARFLNVV